MHPSMCDEQGDWLGRQALCEWFATALGTSLQIAEIDRLRAILPQLYGAVAVQVGCIGSQDWLAGCAIPTRLLYDVAAAPATPTVRGIPEALPFASKTISLAVLPHTLDFALDPHQVLREVDRILTPEGHVVIVGFNPLSLWGLWRVFDLRRGRVPWCGHFLRLMRVKDWLALLDFEIVNGSMLWYRPPLQRERSMERLRFLEAMGDRWWPLAAAVYVVVAKKRELGLTPLRPAWRRRLVGRRVTQPLAKSG